jgi:anti-anti-sigma regulatory factor
MEIRERVIDGVSILDVKGKLTLGEACGEVKKQVRSLLGDGQKRIVIDLAGLTGIDRAGIDALLACHRTLVEREGGKFKVALPPAYGFWGSVKRRILFQKQLNPTQLFSVATSGLTCYQNVGEAIESFNKIE